MLYRVTLKDPVNTLGEMVVAPAGRVQVEFPDGVVMNRSFVEREPPTGLHLEPSMTEDDYFLDLGYEIWDYEVTDGREDEFLAALKNSGLAIECVPLDEGSHVGAGTDK